MKGLLGMHFFKMYLGLSTIGWSEESLISTHSSILSSGRKTSFRGLTRRTYRGENNLELA